MMKLGYYEKMDITRTCPKPVWGSTSLLAWIRRVHVQQYWPWLLAVWQEMEKLARDIATRQAIATKPFGHEMRRQEATTDWKGIPKVTRWSDMRTWMDRHSMAHHGTPIQQDAWKPSFVAQYLRILEGTRGYSRSQFFSVPNVFLHFFFALEVDYFRSYLGDGWLSKGWGCSFFYQLENASYKASWPTHPCAAGRVPMICLFFGARVRRGTQRHLGSSILSGVFNIIERVWGGDLTDLISQTTLLFTSWNKLLPKCKGWNVHNCFVPAYTRWCICYYCMWFQHVTSRVCQSVGRHDNLMLWMLWCDYHIKCRQDVGIDWC